MCTYMLITIYCSPICAEYSVYRVRTSAINMFIRNWKKHKYQGMSEFLQGPKTPSDPKVLMKHVGQHWHCCFVVICFSCIRIAYLVSVLKLGCIPESMVNLPSAKPKTFRWLASNLAYSRYMVPKMRPGVSSFSTEQRIDESLWKKKQLSSDLEQWAADTTAPGEQLGVRCLAQGSHLSRGQFQPEPRFELTTSGYKSNAMSHNLLFGIPPALQREIV